MDELEDEIELPQQTIATPVFNPYITTSVNNEKLEDTKFAKELDEEERLKKSQERIGMIKRLSLKLSRPSDIEDLENEPAYIRKKLNWIMFNTRRIISLDIH